MCRFCPTPPSSRMWAGRSWDAQRHRPGRGRFGHVLDRFRVGRCSVRHRGNELRAGPAGIDFEAGSTRSVQIQARDAAGLTRNQTFTITVLNTNEEPITSLAIPEIPRSERGGDVLDGRATGPFTYHSLRVMVRRTTVVHDLGQSIADEHPTRFRDPKTYSVRVRSTPTAGGPFDRVFTISVTDQPENPTAIALSITSGAGKKRPSGREVGTLSATDPDAGSSFTFALVPGTGADDNGSFTITGGNRRFRPRCSIAKRTGAFGAGTGDGQHRTHVRSGVPHQRCQRQRTADECDVRGRWKRAGKRRVVPSEHHVERPDIGDNIIPTRPARPKLASRTIRSCSRSGTEIRCSLGRLRSTTKRGRAWSSCVRRTRPIFVETSVTVNVIDQNDAHPREPDRRLGDGERHRTEIVRRPGHVPTPTPLTISPTHSFRRRRERMTTPCSH